MVAIAAFHLTLSVFCVVWGFGASMARFDTGEAPSLTESITKAGAEILLFPMSSLDSLFSPHLFPGL